jgi:hypothetical protein
MSIKIIDNPFFALPPMPDIYAVNDAGTFMHDMIAERCGIDLSMYFIVHLDGEGLNNVTENLAAVLI